MYVASQLGHLPAPKRTTRKSIGRCFKAATYMLEMHARETGEVRLSQLNMRLHALWTDWKRFA